MADTSDNQDREHLENETTHLIDNGTVTMLKGKENIILVKFMKTHDDAKNTITFENTYYYTHLL